MKKFTLKTIIIFALILILLAISVLFSMAKFAVINPFSACFGMAKILCTNTKYTIVQSEPYKVAFAKSEYNGKVAQEFLDEYMETRGFIQKDRNGSIVIYINGNDEERIQFSVNKYYSVWEWI